MSSSYAKATDDGPRRDYTEHNFGLTFQDQTPKPSFAAVAFMTRLFGEAKPILGSQGDNYKINRRYAFVLPDGRKAYAMWAVEKPVEVEIPSDVRGGSVFDLMGNRSDLGDRTKLTLTESPVYVVAQDRPTSVRVPGAFHRAEIRAHVGIPSIAVSPVNGRMWATIVKCHDIGLLIQVVYCGSSDSVILQLKL